MKHSNTIPNIPQDVLNAVRARCRRVDFPELHLAHLSALNTSGGWGGCFRRVQQMVGTGAVVVLLGPAGTGKTQIATATAAGIMALDMSQDQFADEVELAQYVRGADFCHIARCNGNDIMVEALAAPRLLVLDWIGPWVLSADEVRLLTAVIAQRYDRRHDTILIGNWSAEGFAENVGADIMGYVAETGAVITCNWPSFRQKPAGGAA